jgi:hypothetical protein
MWSRPGTTRGKTGGRRQVSVEGPLADTGAGLRRLRTSLSQMCGWAVGQEYAPLAVGAFGRWRVLVVSCVDSCALG